MSAHLLNVVMAIRKTVLRVINLSLAFLNGSSGDFCKISNTLIKSNSGTNLADGGLETKTPFNNLLNLGVVRTDHSRHH